MRSKYKSSEGSGIIEFDDGATLGTVYEMLRNETGINSFSIKIGPPMAMKTLDTRQMDVLARSLGLNNETLTIVSEDPKVEPATMAATPGRMPQQTASHTPEKSSAADIDEIYVPWPARDGTLRRLYPVLSRIHKKLPCTGLLTVSKIVLRVMPSDNSCLFTAFGGALPQQIPPPKLRQMMAEYIQQHPAVYTEAVLGAPAEQYCRNILDPDRWGGGIELSILSSIFDIRICTFDIQVSREHAHEKEVVPIYKMRHRHKASLHSGRTKRISVSWPTLEYITTAWHSATPSSHTPVHNCPQRWIAQPGPYMTKR